MAIDKEKLHKLHKESEALLGSLADRLPPEPLKQYRTFSFVGEWNLLVNGLCASLVRGKIPITAGERDALAAVLTIYPPPGGRYKYMNNVEETLAALNVVE